MTCILPKHFNETNKCKELPDRECFDIIIAGFEKVGAILDLPCPSVIL